MTIGAETAMNDAASNEGQTGDGAAPPIALGKGRALVPIPQAAAKAEFFAGLGRSHGFVAAGVAVVMGVGFVAATAVFASKPQTVVLAQAAPPTDTTMDVLYRVQGEVRSLKAGLDGMRAAADDGRQSETIRGLKKSVDLLKQDLEGVKAASTGAVGQLGAKLDKLDRDPGPKLNEIAARLDRIEKQVAASDVTGSIPSPAAAQSRAPLPPQRAPQPVVTASAAAPAILAPPVRAEAAKAEAPKADIVARADVPAQPRAQEAPAKPATVEGWLLRDVYGGVALVEGRAGGLREVAPGEFVPGVGEIRSIERRGRGWVVVTSRGLIQADNRW